MNASVGWRQQIGRSDSRTFYERRVVVRDGSIDIVRRSTLKETSICHSWLPDSIISMDGLWKLQFMVFESNSHLTRIEPYAFSQSSLQSIFIPCNVEILEAACFAHCESLLSITFESNSRLTRIGWGAFTQTALQSILIPSSVEVLEDLCFSGCRSLSSIIFDSNSRLTRIEQLAFLYSSLQSIVIPRHIGFIDGSAFSGLNQLSVSIESGNDILIIDNGFLIDIIHHKLIHVFSKSEEIELGRNIEMLEIRCFAFCHVRSIRFESNSPLTRIESQAFASSSLKSIMIPSNVESIGSGCFLNCGSLSSITFESNSHLTRIESEAFRESALQSILIPRNVEILGSRCFLYCHPLSSITFESNSHLRRIESKI
jgi:uncharacterized protein YuzB (UPF0349 family)